jgi:hypothetical protein
MCPPGKTWGWGDNAGYCCENNTDCVGAVLIGGPTPAPTQAPTRAPALAPTRTPFAPPAGWQRFAITDKAGLRMKGKRVPQIVNKGGLPAFEVVYPARSRGGGSTNMHITMAPAGFFPSDQCRFQFKWWVDDSFQLVPTKTQPIGGKILGFRVGKGKASGGNYSTTAATYRVTFGSYGAIVPYLYFQLKRDFRRGEGEKSWALLDQIPEVQRVADVSSGTHLWDGKHDPNYPLKIKKGQWNTIELFLKLNTVGKYDGVIELAVNGVRKRQEGIRFRYTDIKIEQMEIHPFWGGHWTTPNATKSWYADFAFSRT